MENFILCALTFAVTKKSMIENLAFYTVIDIIQWWMPCFAIINENQWFIVLRDFKIRRKWVICFTYRENRQEKLEIIAGKSNFALSLPLPIALLNWFTSYRFTNSWILLEDRIIRLFNSNAWRFPLKCWNIFYCQYVACFEIPDDLKHVQVSIKQFFKKVG